MDCIYRSAERHLSILSSKGMTKAFPCALSSTKASSVSGTSVMPSLQAETMKLCSSSLRVGAAPNHAPSRRFKYRTGARQLGFSTTLESLTTALSKYHDNTTCSSGDHPQ